MASPLPAIGRRQTIASLRTKLAELGGQDNGTEFEEAFSNIAHSFLRDKAPSLQQYELGFQLLDRNEDSTKAVGIFGFKIGSQLVYAPCFFLNGELKGHELLYLKDQDQFIPLKENWINSLLNKKPNVLGAPVDNNSSRLGITQPNLRRFSHAPYKYASSIKPQLLPGAAAFAHFATTNPLSATKYAGMTDLGTFLKNEGAETIRALVSHLTAQPVVAEKFASEFGGLGVIKAAVEHCRPVEEGRGVLAEKKAVKKLMAGEPASRKFESTTANGGVPTYGAAALKSADKYSRSEFDPSPYFKTAGSQVYGQKPGQRKRPKYTPAGHQSRGVMSGTVSVSKSAGTLDVLTPDNFDPRSPLDAESREKLLRDGVLFLDKRADDAVVTVVEGPKTLTNPTETGVYDVLVKPGTFERCVVFLGPYSHRGRQQFATVVRAADGGDKAWLNTHPANVWVRQKSEAGWGDYDKWVDSQPAADSLPEASYSGLYMLVGPLGQSSCPFRVRDPLSTDGDVKAYDVGFRDYACAGRPGHMPPLQRYEGYRAYDYDEGERVTLTGKAGGRMRSAGGDLFVPKGFKLVTLVKGSDTQDGEGDDGAYSLPPPIVPGTPSDLERFVFDKTAQYKVCHTGTEVQVDGDSFSPQAGLVHLVRDVGLREADARAILKEALAKKVVRFRAKAAAMSVGPGPNAPGFPDVPSGSDPMGLGYPAAPSMEANVAVGIPPGDPAIYAAMPPPDPKAMQAASDAASTGQKEVLDTALIGSILKSVRDDTMVDRYIGDLMKALDRLGRILFSFYWHGEQFQDRYGKQDMPELEDGLRNTFESLGDLVLHLKDKSIEPFPDEMSHPDVGDAAA